MKSHVVIIGSYPPPAGGNSSHIERCFRQFHEYGIKCDVLDMYSGGSNIKGKSGVVYRVGRSKFVAIIDCFKKLYELKPDVIHIHVSAFLRFAIFSIIFRVVGPRKPLKVMTVHSGSFVGDYENRSWVYRKLVVYACLMFDKIITVSEEQKELIKKITNNGVVIKVIPAFIPVDLSKPDISLVRKLDKYNNESNYLICTSGNGLEFYGYHQIIESILHAKLQDKVTLLIFLYNNIDEEYVKRLMSFEDKINLHIERNLTAEQFSYFLSNSNLYIRATDRDGDSVAIREAHQCGVTVVASNVIERPSFCHIYNYGDKDDMAELIKRLFLGGTENRHIYQNNMNPIEEIISTYN